MIRGIHKGLCCAVNFISPLQLDLLPPQTPPSCASKLCVNVYKRHVYAAV